MKRTAIVASIIVIAFVAWLAWPPEVPEPVGEPEAEATAVGPAWFRDVATEAGIDFAYHNGEESDHFTILESLGGGVALFDYDNDGKLDVFLVGGGRFTPGEPFGVAGLPNRMYRNLGGWKFADVTAEVGLAGGAFYGHGAAACDFDGDGFTDLLVTGFGGLTLYRNDNGKRFADVTEASGLKRPTWATSAAWGDLDGDGRPDLYVCQYVDWSPRTHKVCEKDVCPPQEFPPLRGFVYRNLGGGRFDDKSEAAKLRADGKGLGMLLCDLNLDGRPDIYAANDASDNFLYFNRGGWAFDEVGVEMGVARDDQGTYDGSMGVDVADIDGSGRPSLLVTNFQNEWHAVYRNVSEKRFAYASREFGIAALGQSFVGFGIAFADYDLDGLEDVIIANGHVVRHPRGATFAQKPVLMRGTATNGRRKFDRVDGGPYFRSDHLGRGLATGDLDNDGRVDVVISHQNAPVAVLRNETPERPWVGVGWHGLPPVGGRLTFGNGATRFVKGGGSYLSSSDARIVVAGESKTMTIILPFGQANESQVLHPLRYTSWRNP